MLQSPSSDLVCTFAVLVSLVSLAFLVVEPKETPSSRDSGCRSRSSSPHPPTPYPFDSVDQRNDRTESSEYIKYRRVLLA
jgi:hypothetical protein